MGAMRFLVLSLDVDTKRGIQRYTRILVTSLAELYGADNVGLLTLLGPVTSIRDVRVLGWGGRDLTLLTKAKFVALCLYHAVRWKPHIVICSHLSTAPVAWILKQAWGLPYMCVAHGLEAWGDLSISKRRGLEEADLILSVSDFTKNMLLSKFDTAEGPIRLLRNVVDTSLLEACVSRDEICQRHDLVGKRVILTVGHLAADEQYKGHDTVIRALEQVRDQLPEVRYVIVGDGNDRLRLQRLATDLGVSDLVVFAGEVNDAILAEYYQSADVFVMPSRLQEENGKWLGEGFGIVYLEAAAFGKPSIAGKHGGSAEAVVDGVTGLLVDPGSVEEVANAIIRLLGDQDLARRMGEAARERVLREFTRERFKQDLAGIIEEWTGNQ